MRPLTFLKIKGRVHVADTNGFRLETLLDKVGRESRRWLNMISIENVNSWEINCGLSTFSQYRVSVNCLEALRCQLQLVTTIMGEQQLGVHQKGSYRRKASKAMLELLPSERKTWKVGLEKFVWTTPRSRSLRDNPFCFKGFVSGVCWGTQSTAGLQFIHARFAKRRSKKSGKVPIMPFDHIAAYVPMFVSCCFLCYNLDKHQSSGCLLPPHAAWLYTRFRYPTIA